MANRTDRHIAGDSLGELCGLIIEGKHAFNELSGLIEKKAYTECERGEFKRSVERIEGVASYYEKIENKNDGHCRDLSDVYLLIGDMFQFVGRLSESIQWYEKAIIINDRYDAAYHGMAKSYLKMGRKKHAIKCLEQEIHFSPGNYYSHLMLANLYDESGEEGLFTQTLENLLDRDPQNVMALHKLICHYEKENPKIEVELLRRRLVGIKVRSSEIELVIWVYHMCFENRDKEAMAELIRRREDNGSFCVYYILKAYIHGRMKQHKKQKIELAEFQKCCDRRKEIIDKKLEEFQSVFGGKAASHIRKIINKL